MSHTDKAFIKAFRASATGGPKRAPLANPSAATIVDAPSSPGDALTEQAAPRAVAEPQAPHVVEPTPAVKAAPALRSGSGAQPQAVSKPTSVAEPTPIAAVAAPVAVAPPAEPETLYAQETPVAAPPSFTSPSYTPPTERARPKLGRAEEAFLAGDSSAAPESVETSSPPVAETSRPESRWKPEVFAQAATVVSEPPPAKAEPIAKPEPRAYVEPADEAESEATRISDGGSSSGPPTRGVHSLADMTQISTAVTDWGPAEKVERFEFPEVCDNLLEVAGHEFAALADEIAVRSKEGEKLYLAASCQGNEGATTVVLCLARTLAARGLRTVVVDQDVTHPGLAEALHLNPSTGWAEVLSGEAALAEALVESEEEPLAVLPMCTSDQPQAIAPAARQRLCLGLLKQHFDVVLLDAGPLHLTPHEQLAQPLLDAAIIVYDPQSSADAELDDAIERLAEAGLPLAAVAENFYVDVA